jgi:hypothetical protein
MSGEPEKRPVPYGNGTGNAINLGGSQGSKKSRPSAASNNNNNENVSRPSLTTSSFGSSALAAAAAASSAQAAPTAAAAASSAPAAAAFFPAPNGLDPIRALLLAETQSTQALTERVVNLLRQLNEFLTSVTVPSLAPDSPDFGQGQEFVRRIDRFLKLLESAIDKNLTNHNRVKQLGPRSDEILAHVANRNHMNDLREQLSRKQWYLKKILPIVVVPSRRDVMGASPVSVYLDWCEQFNHKIIPDTEMVDACTRGVSKASIQRLLEEAIFLIELYFTHEPQHDRPKGYAATRIIAVLGRIHSFIKKSDNAIRVEILDLLVRLKRTEAYYAWYGKTGTTEFNLSSVFSVTDAAPSQEVVSEWVAVKGGALAPSNCNDLMLSLYFDGYKNVSVLPLLEGRARRLAPFEVRCRVGPRMMVRFGIGGKCYFSADCRTKYAVVNGYPTQTYEDSMPVTIKLNKQGYSRVVCAGLQFPHSNPPKRCTIPHVAAMAVSATTVATILTQAHAYGFIDHQGLFCRSDYDLNIVSYLANHIFKILNGYTTPDGQAPSVAAAAAAAAATGAFAPTQASQRVSETPVSKGSHFEGPDGYKTWFTERKEGFKDKMNSPLTRGGEPFLQLAELLLAIVRRRLIEFVATNPGTELDKFRESKEMFKAIFDIFYLKSQTDGNVRAESFFRLLLSGNVDTKCIAFNTPDHGNAYIMALLGALLDIKVVARSSSNVRVASVVRASFMRSKEDFCTMLDIPFECFAAADGGRGMSAAMGGGGSSSSSSSSSSGSSTTVRKGGGSSDSRLALAPEEQEQFVAWATDVVKHTNAARLSLLCRQAAEFEYGGLRFSHYRRAILSLTLLEDKTENERLYSCIRKGILPPSSVAEHPVGAGLPTQMPSDVFDPSENTELMSQTMRIVKSALAEELLKLTELDAIAKAAPTAAEEAAAEAAAAAAPAAEAAAFAAATAASSLEVSGSTEAAAAETPAAAAAQSSPKAVIATAAAETAAETAAAAARDTEETDARLGAASSAPTAAAATAVSSSPAQTAASSSAAAAAAESNGLTYFDAAGSTADSASNQEELIFNEIEKLFNGEATTIRGLAAEQAAQAAAVAAEAAGLEGGLTPMSQYRRTKTRVANSRLSRKQNRKPKTRRTPRRKNKTRRRK